MESTLLFDDVFVVDVAPDSSWVAISLISTFSDNMIHSHQSVESGKKSILVILQRLQLLFKVFCNCNPPFQGMRHKSGNLLLLEILHLGSKILFYVRSLVWKQILTFMFVFISKL